METQPQRRPDYDDRPSEERLHDGQRIYEEIYPMLRDMIGPITDADIEHLGTRGQYDPNERSFEYILLQLCFRYANNHFYEFVPIYKNVMQNPDPHKLQFARKITSALFYPMQLTAQSYLIKKIHIDGPKGQYEERLYDEDMDAQVFEDTMYKLANHRNITERGLVIILSDHKIDDKLPISMN